MKRPRHYSGLRASTRFLLTTFLITWPAWWLNAVLTSTGIIDYSSPIGTANHTAGVFGPTIAGLSLIPGGFTLKRGLAFTFGGLRRSLPWTAAFLVVPLVLLTAASDGLTESFSPISAMGAFLFSQPVLPPGRFGACGICRCGSRRALEGRRPRFLRSQPSPCSSRSGCRRSIARAGAPSPAAFSMRWRTR